MEDLIWISINMDVVAVVAAVAATIAVIYCYLRFVVPDFEEKRRRKEEKAAEKALKNQITLQETLKYSLITDTAGKKAVELNQKILDITERK